MTSRVATPAKCPDLAPDFEKAVSDLGGIGTEGLRVLLQRGSVLTLIKASAWLLMGAQPQAKCWASTKTLSAFPTNHVALRDDECHGVSGRESELSDGGGATKPSSHEGTTTSSRSRGPYPKCKPVARARAREPPSTDSVETVSLPTTPSLKPTMTSRSVGMPRHVTSLRMLGTSLRSVRCAAHQDEI